MIEAEDGQSFVGFRGRAEPTIRARTVRLGEQGDGDPEGEGGLEGKREIRLLG